MTFLDSVLQNAGSLSSSVRLGSGLAQGVGALLQPGLQRSVNREVNKTNQAFASVNAKRIAREMRYAQGQAIAANAGAGNTQHGSFVFAAAANARAAEERRQGALLGARINEIALETQVPSGLEAGTSFVGSVLGATARFANDTFVSEE